MQTISLSEGVVDTPMGVPVMSADGRRLGVVAQVELHELLVEGGRYSPHTYALNRIDVAKDQDGILQLKLTADEALEQRVVA